MERAKVCERNYEAFEANRRFEETTDLAERLGFPIRTIIHYDLVGGSLYARTDTKMRPFIEQTYQAKQEAPYLFTGDQAFEAVRRSHEHDEAMMVEAFARGELPGTILIKVSKVPDAVVENRTSIKGYRRDSLRTFIRIYQRGDDAVSCTLYSIDGNNTEGLDRVGDLLNMRLTGRSSEAILADCRLLNVSPDDSGVFVQDLADATISVYDEAIYRQRGERTRAGSRFIDQLDAQTAVESHKFLLKQHFDAIAAIAGMALSDVAKEDLYEIEREHTAAAISLSSRGYQVVSTSDAAVAVEVERGDYGRECATATENAMQQGESDLLKDWKKIVQHCPMCGAEKVMAEKTGEIISGSCGCNLNVCTGKYWRNPKPARRTDTLEAALPQPGEKVNKPKHINQLFGRQAILRTRTIVGGGYFEIVDTRTGEVRQTAKSKKELFALAA